MMKKHKKTIKQKQSKCKQAKRDIKKEFRKKIKKILAKRFGWKKTTASIAGSLIMGLLTVKGVWHKKFAQTMDDENQVESDIRAIQRFFAHTYLDYRSCGLVLFNMLKIEEKVTIILDRSNWKRGKKPINLFVAAVLYHCPGSTQSFAVPVVWEVLNKNGTSNTDDRKQLMQRLIAIVGMNNIEAVLGDREFIGHEWIQFLHKLSIPFIIRIRNNMYVKYQEKRINVLGLFSNVQYNERVKYDVTLNDIPMQLVATRSAEGELVVVIASADITGDPLNQYRFRWLIELFFKSIKSRGFDLEETHMTDPERIKLLFALIAFATVMAVQAGMIKNHFKKIRIKNHGRPTYSLFTYGLDFLRSLFRGTIPKFCNQICDLLLQSTNFLLEPPQPESDIYAL